MAAYALGGTPLVLYYGIRRYPYSFDMTKDPLTFKHIQEGTPLPTNPPPLFGERVGNSEVHNVGEVWAATLWDAYVGLLRDTAHHSYDEAITQMRDYLVASYKLTPPNPTILEARDAMLVAVLANSGSPSDLDASPRRSLAVAWASTPSARPPTRRTSLASRRARSAVPISSSPTPRSPTTCRTATTTGPSTTARRARSRCSSTTPVGRC